MIKLYASSIFTIKNEEINDYASFISKQRRDRIRNFRNTDDMKRSLLAELLVRKIVMNWYDLKNSQIFFNLNPFGKPFIKNLPHFQFNLSHSGQWVVFAVGNKAVGVDIQEIREIDLDTVKYLLNEREIYEFLNLAQDKRQEYFFLRWTRKESYLKVIGTGFMEYGPNREIPEENIYFKTFNIDPGYSLSVWAYEDEFEPEINFLEICQADFDNH